MDQVEEVLAKTDIVELINERVSLKKAGRNFKALCPFHSEKTPSFIVSPERQIFKCFGCNIGGDAYKFLMEYEKMDFGEALRYLADRANVELKSYQPRGDEAIKKKLYQVNHLAAELYYYLLTKHEAGQKARDYLADRGIKKEIIEEFRLGYAPNRWQMLKEFLVDKKGLESENVIKAGLVFENRRGQLTDRFRGRVMFPLLDNRDHIVGFSGRLLEERENAGKYINTPETPIYHKSQLLFGLTQAKDALRKQKKAIVVEGEFDMISPFQAGIENIVAIKGSALTIEQIKLLKRYVDELLLALDADTAGQKATRRGIQLAVNEGLNVEVITLGEYKDPDDAVRADPEFFREQIKKAQSIFDYYIESALERFDQASAWGKKQIVDDLAPVLLAIDDEVLRSHYVRRLAEELGIDEQAILEKTRQADSLFTSQTRQENKRFQKKAEKDRRQVLEEYLFAIAFQYQHEEVLIDENLAGCLSNPGLERIIEQLKEFLAENDEFDSETFVKELPEELKAIFNDFYLVPLPEKLADPNRQDKEIAQVKEELVALSLRAKINDLTRQVAQLEKEGQSEKVTELQEKIAQMIQKRKAVLK